MPEPSPAQVDAMREWIATRPGVAHEGADVYWRTSAETAAVGCWIATFYPGGVEQFLADHKEQA